MSSRRADSERDVYVWSDGSVTGPKGDDERVSDLRLVAMFSPGEFPSESDIRTSLLNGMAAEKSVDRTEVEDAASAGDAKVA